MVKPSFLCCCVYDLSPLGVGGRCVCCFHTFNLAETTGDLQICPNGERGSFGAKRKTYRPTSDTGASTRLVQSSGRVERTGGLWRMRDGRTPIRGLLSRALSYGGTGELSCIGGEAGSLSHKDQLTTRYGRPTSWQTSPAALCWPHVFR